MAKTRFLFDHDFAQEERDAAKPKQPTFSLDELEAARAMARAEGAEAGKAEAMASIERKTADTLIALGKQLAASAAAREAAMARIEAGAVELCAGLLRKLFPALQQQHGLGEIEGLLRQALRAMADEPRVVVRLNDTLLDALQPRVDALSKSSGFAGRVVLVGDEMVAPGDCAIEWADGGAERLGDQLWADVDALIRRMGETTGDAAAPGAAAAQ
ncbi:MAG: hypothetical protein L6R19_27415 [Alphaproteobacteria bacterium]|nr:hypothetical protein [Alphaproteobacteria bacterium]